jgi:hypothetical protein
VTRTLLIAMAALLTLFGTVLIVHAVRAPDTVRIPRADLKGTWLARGLVESAQGAADQRAGMKLTRQWIFFTRCAGGRCELWLAREAAKASEMARVDRDGDELRAVFTNVTTGCDTPMTLGKLKRTFHINATATGGGLRASETVRGNYPGCHPSGHDALVLSSLTWTVAKVSAECPSMLACSTPWQPGTAP